LLEGRAGGQPLARYAILPSLKLLSKSDPDSVPGGRYCVSSNWDFLLFSILSAEGIFNPSNSLTQQNASPLKQKVGCGRHMGINTNSRICGITLAAYYTGCHLNGKFRSGARQVNDG
jgi:hypothetical protein